MTARFAEGRPNIIWLEDRENTARVELGVAESLGCRIQLRAYPVEIMSLLDEEFGADYKPEVLDQWRIAFVIDVMIAGLLDLSALGIRHSETHGGLNGGYVFADRVLREIHSPCRYRPVCFLSERQLTTDLEEDLDYLRTRKDPGGDGRLHGPVEYVRKFNSSELNRFKDFLGSV